MVACKILQEGTLLYGSEDLFSTIKGMLKKQGLTQRLNALEVRAGHFRRDAEKHLLKGDPEKVREEYQHLFYPTDESRNLNEAVCRLAYLNRVEQIDAQHTINKFVTQVSHPDY